MADVLADILRAAGRHPNSRVSKLINIVDEESTQKNIVLLLIELADHAEYSTDFNISLKYYLDLFERLGINHDLVLNEAGLLLVNASKIYCKRVDYVQSLVERHVLTLSNADDELQKQKLEERQAENVISVEKPKRGRKRALDAPTDLYEIELAPKKFKKLTGDKRFVATKTVQKIKSISRNIEMENHIHPAGWQHSTIYDLENEEEVDTKRNYKLFTFHVEHRYNTLVPDINFRLHFKVKDYIDEQEEMEENEACNTDRSWPPLSEAYVQKYLRLENYVLQQDLMLNERISSTPLQELHDLTKEPRNYSKAVNSTLKPADEPPPLNLNDSSILNVSISSKNDSQLEDSTLKSCLANSTLNLEPNLATKAQGELESSSINGNNDTGLGQSILDESNNTLLNSQFSSLEETSIMAEHVNSSKLAEANQSLNAVESQADNDLMVESSQGLDQGANKENGLNITEVVLNAAENQQETNSSLGGNVLDHASNIENNIIIESKTETSGDLDNTTKQQDGDLEPNQRPLEDSTKSIETVMDSVLNDAHDSIPASTENVVNSNEDLNKGNEKNNRNLNIDVVENQNKKTTQIRVHLPCTDDEGVCLSDLEERDHRLLSPVIRITNILPGVERKDVTIIMDDELRKALEMKDGVLKHFGREIYKVPVITEEKRQNLFFNILKLPEKKLRRKLLFKLGPEMDLYLQARSFKRSRAEPAARGGYNAQLQQWHALNNTDVSGIPFTPPNSPGHCSDFCGFSDYEDDAMSCAEFCGFTEEEQSTLMAKQICRLSRDSGVGVDVHTLSPDKETFDITFENADGVRNSHSSLNVDAMQSTESILSQLPVDIRDVLTKEIEGSGENKENETNGQNLKSMPTENLTDDKAQNCNESGISLMSTENIEITENSTQESNVVTTETSVETSTEQSAIKGESVSISEFQNKSNDREGSKNSDIEMFDNVPSSVEKSTKSPELLKEKNIISNNMDVDTNSSDGDLILDLEAQGRKTKIQQWHEYLQPILNKSRERHHFDIYELGTDIIDTLQSRRNSSDEFSNELESTSERSNCSMASFEDIMESKDKSYVSRYFLSTLLLANQSNIEITTYNKSPETPSSWHDIELKLINTKRHTVSIEDNIGIINKKQNVREKKKEIENSVTNDRQDNDEEQNEYESLKKACKQLKSPLKRSNNSETTSNIAEKKSKEILPPTSTTNIRHTVWQNGGILTTSTNTPTMTCTSRKAQKTSTDLFNAKINDVRTLKPIEKVHKNGDDYDSGIFSIDEMSTS